VLPGKVDVVAERTRASAPAAHPTATPRPERRTERTTRETRGVEASGNDREPQKPTTVATSIPEGDNTASAAHRTGRLPVAPTARSAYGQKSDGTKGAQGKAPLRRNVCGATTS
jgi:hypothetical protein